MKIDAPRVDLALESPYLPEQLLLGYDRPACSSQDLQELELLWTKLHLPGASGDCPNIQVHNTIPDGNLADLARSGSRSAQVDLQSFQQLEQEKWLGDIVIGAKLQRSDSIDLIGPRGKHDRWQRRARAAQPPEHIEAIHYRQTQVQNQHGGVDPMSRLNDFAAVFDMFNLIALELEVVSKARGEGAIALRQKYP
ncbi:MAG: hypothetical protein WEE89_07665 [Gemmatimonadota bacterium]